MDLLSDFDVVVITSREPFNEEGNSHMHYLQEITSRKKVIFINPPECWPPKKIRKRTVNENLTILPYFNFLPYKVLPNLAGGVNDFFTSLVLRKILNSKRVLLWQFDPYYLHKLFFINIMRKVYFPLDGYSSDYRDKIFASRADLLVTVNSTFIENYYKNYTSKILLLPHGFGAVHSLPEEKVVINLNSQYGNYIIITGSLSFGVDFELLEKIADEIFPRKLLVVGKKLVADSVLKNLLSKSNVIYLGPKSYKELNNFIAAANVCIVTYNAETGTWRNPIKITDYLAQNKPIINTIPLKDLERLEGNGLFTAFDNHSKYLELLQKALEGSIKVNLKTYKEWIDNNLYSKLFERIIKTLK